MTNVRLTMEDVLKTVLIQTADIAAIVTKDTLRYSNGMVWQVCV